MLIVDEVDDTRTTLAYCVEELLKTHSPKAGMCVLPSVSLYMKTIISILHSILYFNPTTLFAIYDVFS